MAAANVVNEGSINFGGGIQVIMKELNTLTTDQDEDVAHGGPSGVLPVAVIPVQTAQATSEELVTCSWNKAADSAANNTCRLVFAVENGGSISGAKFRVYFVFLQAASGGVS